MKFDIDFWEKPLLFTKLFVQTAKLPICNALWHVRINIFRDKGFQRKI